LQATLAAAAHRRVRASPVVGVRPGTSARRTLYRSAGFVVEGTRVRGKKLDGEYDDVLMMAYFCEEHRDGL
jgi:hypothetical protein